MEDIPYSTLKENNRAYRIMLLRDQYNISFNDISKEYGISRKTAKDIYCRHKNKQIHLYMNHISITLGHDSFDEIEKSYFTIYECYQDSSYVCAYFEKEYCDILTEYRCGEPGMPLEFVENLPPLRYKLRETEVKRVVDMHEKEKISFIEIADELCITEAKAKRLYDLYYHEKVMKIFNELVVRAKSDDEKLKLRNYIFENNLSPKRVYKMLTENDI